MHSNMLCGFWRRRKRMNDDEEEDNDDDNSTETHQRQESPGVLSSLSRMQDMQETKRKALICQTENVCASEKARTDAVLARLKLSAQHGPQPSRQLPSVSRHNPETVCTNRTPWTQRHQQTPKIQKGKILNRNQNEPRRRPSRIPIMLVNLSGQDKRVAGGHRLHTASQQVEAIREALQHFCGNSDVHQPRPPSVTRRTHTVTPVNTVPPEPFSPWEREIHHGTYLCPANVVDNEMKQTKKTENVCNVRKTVEMLQPLSDPADSLSLCLKQLGSKDWEKKIKGLQSVRALAQHHADTLMCKLHDVCLAVTAEVKNLRSSVACAAMDTLVYLFVYLTKDMDAHVERSSQALLVKIAQSSANVFIQQQANLALEALVHYCSPGRVLNAMLNTGLSHLSATVRASTAQKLHLLADRLGADAILTAGKSFSERFLTAVSKMSLDAAAEVRTHGHAILQELAHHGDFIRLWKKTIGEKDRRLLRKILRSMMQK